MLQKSSHQLGPSKNLTVLDTEEFFVMPHYLGESLSVCLDGGRIKFAKSGHGKGANDFGSSKIFIKPTSRLGCARKTRITSLAEPGVKV
jgi:hypothetical protein